MKRRFFIGGISAAIGSTAFNFSSDHVSSEAGSIFGIGVKGAGAVPGTSQYESVLTHFDIKTKIWQQFHFPIKDAHSILRTKTGYIIIGNSKQIALLGKDFSLQKTIKISGNEEFGGHGVYLQDRNLLVTGIRFARDMQDHSAPVPIGQLAIIDLKTGSIIKKVSSGGYEPHDMHQLASGEIITVNYGNKTLGDLLHYNKVEPTFSIIDIKDFSIKKIIRAPKLGSISHISINPDGMIGAIPAQLYKMDREGQSIIKTSFSSSIAISPAELIEKKYGAPSPILTYNPTSDQWRSFMQEPKLQRRPQSICFHQKTQSWFVSFPFSDTIGRLSHDGKIKMISAFDLGISLPRGVSVVHADSKYFYVSGQFKGLAKVNAKTLKLEEKWEVPFHDATHITSI